MADKPIILFDGVCNLCNNAVNFVIKRNSKKNLQFASLQSTHSLKLMQHYNYEPAGNQSIILIENNRLYTKSTAALRMCRHLNKLWPLVYGFIIVPRFIRNAVYNFIARNRYKWFGKSEQCMIPSPGIKERFLD